MIQYTETRQRRKFIEDVSLIVILTILISAVWEINTKMNDTLILIDNNYYECITYSVGTSSIVRP